MFAGKNHRLWELVLNRIENTYDENFESKFGKRFDLNETGRDSKKTEMKKNLSLSKTSPSSLYGQTPGVVIGKRDRRRDFSLKDIEDFMQYPDDDTLYYYGGIEPEMEDLQIKGISKIRKRRSRLMSSLTPVNPIYFNDYNLHEQLTRLKLFGTLGTVKTKESMSQIEKMILLEKEMNIQLSKNPNVFKKIIKDLEHSDSNNLEDANKRIEKRKKIHTKTQQVIDRLLDISLQRENKKNTSIHFISQYLPYDSNYIQNMQKLQHQRNILKNEETSQMNRDSSYQLWRRKKIEDRVMRIFKGKEDVFCDPFEVFGITLNPRFDFKPGYPRDFEQYLLMNEPEGTVIRSKVLNKKLEQ